MLAKDSTNPKEAIGSRKLPLNVFPTTAIIAGALGIYEGLCKYGLTNWRATPVRASVYLDACQRHLAAYTEGEEDDPMTGVPHLGNALACIAILIDAKWHGTLIDDRPHPSAAYFEMRRKYEPIVEHLQTIFDDKHPTHFTRQFVLDSQRTMEKMQRHADNAGQGVKELFEQVQKITHPPIQRVKRKYTKATKAKKKAPKK